MLYMGNQVIFIMHDCTPYLTHVICVDFLQSSSASSWRLPLEATVSLYKVK